eukprot:GHVT01091779.1.p1 GENE.GHVT01091779.1~~GHVT01091779.1.p1  ORF type:complete len:694 (-),score=116.86 GHVT01091779.1:577-2658(-)
MARVTACLSMRFCPRRLYASDRTCSRTAAEASRVAAGRGVSDEAAAPCAAAGALGADSCASAELSARWSTANCDDFSGGPPALAGGAVTDQDSPWSSRPSVSPPYASPSGHFFPHGRQLVRRLMLCRYHGLQSLNERPWPRLRKDLVEAARRTMGREGMGTSTRRTKGQRRANCSKPKTETRKKLVGARAGVGAPAVRGRGIGRGDTSPEWMAQLALPAELPGVGVGEWLDDEASFSDRTDTVCQRAEHCFSDNSSSPPRDTVVRAHGKSTHRHSRSCACLVRSPRIRHLEMLNGLSPQESAEGKASQSDSYASLSRPSTTPSGSVPSQMDKLQSMSTIASCSSPSFAAAHGGFPPFFDKSASRSDDTPSYAGRSFASLSTRISAASISPRAGCVHARRSSCPTLGSGNSRPPSYAESKRYAARPTRAHSLPAPASSRHCRRANAAAEFERIRGCHSSFSSGPGSARLRSPRNAATTRPTVRASNRSLKNERRRRQARPLLARVGCNKFPRALYQAASSQGTVERRRTRAAARSTRDRPQTAQMPLPFDMGLATPPGANAALAFFAKGTSGFFWGEQRVPIVYRFFPNYSSSRGGRVGSLFPALVFVPGWAECMMKHMHILHDLYNMGYSVAIIDHRYARRMRTTLKRRGQTHPIPSRVVVVPSSPAPPLARWLAQQLRRLCLACLVLNLQSS